MAERLELSPLSKVDLDTVNAHVRQLNTYLARISDLLDKSVRTLTLKGNMDGGGFRLTNIGTAISNDDALPLGQLESELSELERRLRDDFTSEADGGTGTNSGDDNTSKGNDDTEDNITAQLEGAIPTTAPPNVAAASDVGTTTDPIKFALSDHTHGGVLGAPVAGGSAGQVAFFTSSFQIDGDDDLFWDNTNERLGVGTNTPASTIHTLNDGTVDSIRCESAGAETKVRLINTSTTGFAGFTFAADTASLILNADCSATAGTFFGISRNSLLSIRGATGIFAIGTSTGHDFVLGTGDTERVRIKTGTGRVGIGTSSPSALLDVRGGEIDNYATSSSTRFGQWLAADAAPHFKLAISGGSSGDEMRLDPTVTNGILSIYSDGSEFARVVNSKLGLETTSPATMLDINGDFAYRATGVTLSNGANQDLAIGAFSFIRLTGNTADANVGGLTGGVNGKRVTLYFTVAGFLYTINDEDAGSTAANRIRTLTGANRIFDGSSDGATVDLIYDATLSRWVMLAGRDAAGAR